MRNWTADIPKEEGWYWCKYVGKHGTVKCPCRVTILGDDVAINTGYNDSFYRHGPKLVGYDKEEMKKYKLMFGPKIEESEKEKS